jgi:hypothetical protein
MDRCSIYCLSVNNQERYLEMKERFDKAGMNVTFSESLAVNQLVDENNDNNVEKRIKSCTEGHWDFMHEFYNNSDKDYAIFIEDDVRIYKDFVNVIPKIIEDFEKQNLDILLLGYLLWDEPALFLGNQFLTLLENKINLAYQFQLL